LKVPAAADWVQSILAILIIAMALAAAVSCCACVSRQYQELDLRQRMPDVFCSGCLGCDHKPATAEVRCLVLPFITSAVFTAEAACWRLGHADGW
jgi:hypothetical protein